MSYILERTTFGWCWWDLLALAVLVGVIVYAAITMRKMKEQRKALEDRLAEQEATQAVPGQEQ